MQKVKFLKIKKKSYVDKNSEKYLIPLPQYSPHGLSPPPSPPPKKKTSPYFSLNYYDSFVDSRGLLLFVLT
jgi:hypothetical protein